MGPPAAPHPLQEPPARAPVPQQHLRGEHQKSTEHGGARGGGSGGAKAAGDPPRARGGAPATPPAPLPPASPSLPLSMVLSAAPSERRVMRVLGVGKRGKGEGGARVETVSRPCSAQVLLHAD